MNAPLGETDILLVEDNDDDALLLKKQIREGTKHRRASGINVTRVETLAAAKEAYREQSFDGVFLDLGLPDSHGVATLNSFVETASDVPIIVLTGLRDSQTALDAIQTGAQDYLVKGDITPDAVVRSMRYGIERKKNEQMVRRQRNQIEFFNSILRHDMLNGLSIILAQLELLVDELDEEHRERVENVRDRSEKIVELASKTGDILGTLTDETGGELRAIAVGDVVRDEGRTAERIREGVSVEVTCPDNVWVLANELFADVVKNLLGNAVEHTRPDPVEVEVGVDVRGNSVRLTVTDDGPGVSDRQKPRIFDRGEKGKSSSGSGFGLYFVASMVESYGGEIWVEDADPTGARFVVELRRA